MPDVLTYGGLAVITDVLDASSWYGSWGTGAVAAARANTTLSSEATEARQGVTLTRATTSQTNDTLVGKFTMTCNATAKTVTNAGIFTLNAAGVLILQTSFVGQALTAGNTIAFTFKLKFL
jgi:hypothetical protein